MAQYAKFFSLGAGSDGTLQVQGGLPLSTSLQRIEDQVSNLSNLYLATDKTAIDGTLKIGGVSATESSAILQIDSLTQGLLFPRLTEAQRDAIVSPVAGLTVYNTDTNQLNTYNGSAWVPGGFLYLDEIYDNTVQETIGITPKPAYTNANLALVPNGTGAITASVPDGTATGGNARGDYAVDLQRIRGGSGQCARGAYSVISGGRTNSTTAGYGVVSGGQNNNSLTTYAIVVGGANNNSSGQYSISGGQNNTASGNHSVAFGLNNTATANYAVCFGNDSDAIAGSSSILGGKENRIESQTSVVAGGRDNRILGGLYASEYSGILSGRTNTINNSLYATISGGQDNTASTNTHATVVGGYDNTSSGQYSISGGSGNTASGLSSVALGESNTASGNRGVALGRGNSAGEYSIVAGNGNSGTGTGSVVFGYNNNSGSRNYATISGGISNTISSGSHATVVGGEGNTSSGTYSISGGTNSLASGYNSIALSGGTASGTRSVLVGKGTSQGDGSVSIGNYNNAVAGRSVAIGDGNNATGGGATAIGTGSIAYLRGQFAIGYNLYLDTPTGLQCSIVMSKKQDTLSTGGTTVLSLDGTGTTNLIIPDGDNRLWSAKITATAFVSANSGTTLVNGDSYMAEYTVLFKKVGGTSSVVGTNAGNIIHDPNMAGAAFTFAAGASQDLQITFNAPTAASADTFRCVAKVELVETAF